MSHPRKQVERPYCGSRWTRARFFAFIRTALRKASVKWPPRIDVKVAARRKVQTPGRSKQQKWEFVCAQCGGWFPDKEVEVDHIVPCGKLASFEDIGPFCQRLFVEADGLRLVCHKCHLEHTNSLTSCQ